MVNWEKWSIFGTFSATFVALLVALFPALHSIIFRERPNIRLLDQTGSETTVTTSNVFDEPYERVARFFHLKVKRNLLSRQINGLHIAWREIQVLSPSGDPIDRWQGILPLPWRQEDFDQNAPGKNIGPEWHADLFAVFDHHPAAVGERSKIIYARHRRPNSFPHEIDIPHQICALLEARSDRGLSMWYELRFSWNNDEPRPEAIIFERSSRQSLD